MPEISPRDLEIAQEKNRAYRKQVAEMKELLGQAERRATMYRLQVESAKNIGADHITRAADQVNGLNTLLSRVRRVLTDFSMQLADPTKASLEYVSRDFVEKKLEELTRAVGMEVK